MQILYAFTHSWDGGYTWLIRLLGMCMKLQKDAELSLLEPENQPKKRKKKEKRKTQRGGESKAVDADIEESVMSKKGTNSSCTMILH